MKKTQANKRPKREMAEKMRSNLEKARGVTIFKTAAWLQRKHLRKTREILAKKQ